MQNRQCKTDFELCSVWISQKLSPCASHNGAHEEQQYRVDTRWRSVVNFMPKLLYPSGNNPSTHWIGDLVGLKASMEASEKIKIASVWNQTSDHWDHSLVTLPTGLFWLHVCRYTDYLCSSLPWLCLNTISGVHFAAGCNTHTHTHKRFHFHQSSEHTSMGRAARHMNKSKWRQSIETQ
jgi:hypothetical protein